MGEAKLEREVKENLKKPRFNRKKIEKLIKRLLVELQDDPNRPGLIGTPNRVARMYEEILEGQRYTNEEIAQMFNVTFDDKIVNIPDLVKQTIIPDKLSEIEKSIKEVKNNGQV